MAASVRLALAVVWEEERGRPYVRAKIVDLALVFLGVALVLAAFVANVSMQLVTTYGAELAEQARARAGRREHARRRRSVGLRRSRSRSPRSSSSTGCRRTARRCASSLPGAIVGGIAAHLAIVGFSLYVGLMAGFEELYGTLGSLFGFLFLVYLIASCVVVGAEVVAAWRRPPAHASPKARR